MQLRLMLVYGCAPNALTCPGSSQPAHEMSWAESSDFKEGLGGGGGGALPPVFCGTCDRWYWDATRTCLPKEGVGRHVGPVIMCTNHTNCATARQTHMQLALSLSPFDSVTHCT